MKEENKVNFADHQAQKLALVKEEINVSKKTETKKVFFHKQVIEENVTIPIALNEENIIIQRISKNEEVDVAPGIRTEGDVTIVPILKEEVVITKKMILVEEVHITKKTSSSTLQVDEVIKKEIFKEDNL